MPLPERDFFGIRPFLPVRYQVIRSFHTNETRAIWSTENYSGAVLVKDEDVLVNDMKTFKEASELVIDYLHRCEME